MLKKMMKQIMTISTVLGAVTLPAYAQDLAAGATSYKKCAVCHDVGPAAKNKVGPVLNGLDGRNSGTVAGYNYSESNKASGIVWNETSFLEYIRDPRAKIPNTKMIFTGVKNETEAKSLWVFLKQYAADGKTP